jgi:DNA-binding NarL/FixJ family response regulator
LEQGRPEEAIAIGQPVISNWHQASLTGLALLDGAMIVPVLKLLADSGIPGALAMLRLFPEGISLELGLGRKTTTSAQISLESLSLREEDVLRLLMKGYTNLHIAAELHVSPETVKSHVSHILKKLGVNSRTQAALRARELGF